MKKVFALCIGVLLFTACEQDTIVPEIEEINVDQTTLARKGAKVDVCHKKGKVINVSVNAVSAHQGHGDAVDMDGDGYFDIENPCSEVDLDDTIPFDQNTLVDEDSDGFFTTENPFSEVDCDDTNAEINPEMEEVCDDGVDNNCDGEIDEGCAVDLDQDGYTDDVDCNDNDASINPGAEEVCDDGIDNNCDGLIDPDCEETETIFAIAYTNVDGVDGFDESAGDVLIAKWVDGPVASPDGAIGAGDVIVTNKYPRDVFTTTNFGDFTVSNHVIATVTSMVPGESLTGRSAINELFAFVGDSNRDAYIERTVPNTAYQPTGTTIEDRRSPGFGIDTVHVGPDSPSEPEPNAPPTQFAGSDTPSPHIDVDLFF